VKDQLGRDDEKFCDKWVKQRMLYAPHLPGVAFIGVHGRICSAAIMASHRPPIRHHAYNAARSGHFDKLGGCQQFTGLREKEDG
jgi:hypothetical protein